MATTGLHGGTLKLRTGEVDHALEPLLDLVLGEPVQGGLDVQVVAAGQLAT